MPNKIPLGFHKLTLLHPSDPSRPQILVNNTSLGPSFADRLSDGCSAVKCSVLEGGRSSCPRGRSDGGRSSCPRAKLCSEGGRSSHKVSP